MHAPRLADFSELDPVPDLFPLLFFLDHLGLFCRVNRGSASVAPPSLDRFVLLPGRVVLLDVGGVCRYFAIDFLREESFEFIGDCDVATEVEASHTKAVVKILNESFHDEFRDACEIQV